MNIIICEDDDCCRNIEIDIVKQYMKDNNLDYNILEYNDYNAKFRKNLQASGKKIYILDIETPSASGVDIAREIRKHDVESIIIFVTGYDAYSSLVLKRNIMCLSFLNKFENLKTELTNSLKDACYYLETNKIIKINDSNIDYSIRLNKILYITKDSIDRKTIVMLDNNEYRLNMSLKSLAEILGDAFVQTHRSCYVNKHRVETINHRNKTITFDNGMEIDLLSNIYEKEA